MNAPRLKAESQAYFRTLGKHITELRKEHDMTQAELARALKVSQQTVFAYELGDRRVSVLMLVKLAGIFRTSVEELSGLKMPSQPKCRLTPAGVRLVDQFQKMTKKQQRFVRRIMDVLIAGTELK